jgi:hypothetical protein
MRAGVPCHEWTKNRDGFRPKKDGSRLSTVRVFVMGRNEAPNVARLVNVAWSQLDDLARTGAR